MCFSKNTIFFMGTYIVYITDNLIAFVVYTLNILSFTCENWGQNAVKRFIIAFRDKTLHFSDASYKKAVNDLELRLRKILME